MKHIFSFLFILLLISVSMSAQTPQTTVSGSVADKEGVALTGSTVLFIQSDTIAGGTVTDNKGKFELKGLPAGEYECRVSMIGFKPESREFRLAGKVKLPQFILEEDATALDEVTVSAGMRSKELAGMSIYYLSDRAKNMRSAFEALGEIPILIVNPINRTIQLEDLRSPLILVNGVRKPLDAIDPKVIESVEIIDNPSARYRGDVGVSAVLNVKINKEKVLPYVRGNFGIMTTPNNNFMWDDATLEGGTSTSSLYAKGIYEQRKKLLEDTHSEITQGNLIRMEDGKDRSYWGNLYLMLGGDKDFSKKDYIAYRVAYTSSTSIAHEYSNGTVKDTEKEEISPLNTKFYNNTKFKAFTGNLYYKHSFTKQRILEFDGKYDYSKNTSLGKREAESEIYNYMSDIDLYNTLHLGRLDINYSDMFSSSLHFETGSNTEYSVANIDDRKDKFPLFRYRQTREYIYAGIDNNRSKSKFNYVLSLGFDMVFTDVSGIKHNYFDFVPSISLAYKINNKQNLKFSYSRSRSLPPTSDLNPYNTSTDSLKLNVGNPYLTPTHNNSFKLNYNLYIGKLRFAPYIQYSFSRDIIEPYGYMDNDIYVSTFQNLGHGEELQTGINFNVNMPCGYIGFSPYYAKKYLKDMAFGGGEFVFFCHGRVYYKKVSMDWMFHFIPERSYSLYSKEITGPLYSLIHIQWNPLASWSFTLQVQNFMFPRAHSKSWTINGDYLAYTSSVRRTLSPMISVGVWYSFITRNFKRRNQKSFDEINRELENLKVN